MNIYRLGLITLWLLVQATLATAALGTAFTYQGRLYESGQPASGSYDLRITPFSLESGGSPLASPITTGAVTVEDGVFTVQLDFGSAVFQDDAVWLQIEVDGPNTGFVLLSPRQAVTPTPFAIRASGVTAGGVGNAAIQNGAVTSAKVDASQIQLRVTPPCGVGTAMQSIAQNGTPTCVSTADGNWETLPDGRLQSVLGVRIQPANPADYPFTVRHDSSINSPQIAITETEVGDYTRMSFYNDNDFASFWTLAGRIGGAGPEDHIFNIYHSTGGDLLTLRGDQRVGIGNSNPDAPLMVLSRGNWNPGSGNGRGDVHIGTSAIGLSIGVATGGGGAGASRIWTKGGAEQLFLGSSTDPETLSIFGGQVGIANASPGATLDVNGDVRVRGLIHAETQNKSLEVTQAGDVVAVSKPVSAIKYISFSKDQFSFATSNLLEVPISLPDGVDVDEFTIWYIDNNASFSLALNPIYQELATGAIGGYEGMTSVADPSSTAIRSQTIAWNITINNSIRSYAFNTAVANGAYPSIEIIGVRVAYHHP